MKLFYWLTIVCAMLEVGCGQVSDTDLKVVGGPCEGCEAAFEHPEILASTDTIEGYRDFKNRMILSGTVYEFDGKTPANGIIIYVYQTNPDGIYDAPEAGSIWAKRHGKHRGWIKTDMTGKYVFYTFLPGSYPGRDEPAHIHLTVLEEDKTPYYIEDVLFENDPLLIGDKLARLRNRGGSGICRIDTTNGHLQVQRDIVLGLNIPDYSTSSSK